jgi:hypothetical protein
VGKTPSGWVFVYFRNGHRGAGSMLRTTRRQYRSGITPKIPNEQSISRHPIGSCRIAPQIRTNGNYITAPVLRGRLPPWKSCKVTIRQRAPSDQGGERQLCARAHLFPAHRSGTSSRSGSTSRMASEISGLFPTGLMSRPLVQAMCNPARITGSRASAILLDTRRFERQRESPQINVVQPSETSPLVERIP